MSTALKPPQESTEKVRRSHDRAKARMHRDAGPSNLTFAVIGIAVVVLAAIAYFLS